ncbi:wobble nucleotide-excising tRNase [Tenacibaculum adriaticum]|uniref:Wobble nucleotide-excising tRNase n=1 Tax=Tenacibaculum adriaticum TaxID=413713 RepID=A0A5S5DVD8_9FLAO|nr:AAA family ATPase [Tenacibaculum adriaticum]TYP99238.1 wobble nucleotide-excising tRNase [Tenacibaculum adriaticum]
MITKIDLNKVASYKSQATLETDKALNLIYGLNGTGKSTLSNYLLKRDNEKYKDCSVVGLDENHEILVYNQTFVQENFFESENLKGIFTLSKENKEAITKISNAQKEIEKLDGEKIKKTEELETEKTSISKKLENAKNTIWKIKTDFSGGDRVLEFCLEGHKGSKDNLFNHIQGLTKPNDKPAKSIDDLKNEVQEIMGDNAQKYVYVPKITFSSSSIETEKIFAKQIVGNENSSVSELITKLGNSDWVKSGLKYLPEEPFDENEDCPFCQEKTISNELIENIKGYFDASYEADINSIKTFLEEYSQAIQQIPNKTIFEANPKFETFKQDFEIKFNAFNQLVKSNKKKIEEKTKKPSVSQTLKDSTKSLEDINEIISKINASIKEHNDKIDKKATVKAEIKKTFWQIMRWDYDQTISSYLSDNSTSKTKIDSLNTASKDIGETILEQRSIISEQQKQTVNIEKAIANINDGLIDLGINNFKIENHEENLYKIVRGDNREKVFLSLSEGEKMIISFLYFIEMCRGKQDATETGKKKIIVIDDPISSLSHIYVFNIGRLIKNEFFGKKEIKKDEETGDKINVWKYKYEQVFILTHSLYFFYEITETKHDERKETQKLFRLIKNNNGSNFQIMKYEEIQNDYQAYWSFIKDENQPPALIANCMRNVIEYFFNFVEKKDLNNFFFNQEPFKSSIRFQAFNRYINRESHSLGQNIFDFKEFNYNDFKDGFAELFKVAGYKEHYKKMIK